MKLGIIGSGYVGLVAAACFVDIGNDVICVDVDQSKLVTEWKEFRSLNFDLIKLKMNNNLFIDGRNQFKKEFIENEGFKYIQIGVKV